MACFDSGIKAYVKAQATVTVYFPIDYKDNASIACIHCPFYRTTYRKCGLNESIVNYPEKFVGHECPLIQVEVEEDV
jgi:hypothetical protein